MRRIGAATEVLGAVLLGAVVLVVLFQVVTRYVLRLSVSWPEEAARYLLVWLVFIGAAAAAAKHQQIVVDMVTDFAPRRLKFIGQVVATTAGLGAIAILLWAGMPLFGPASLTTSPATGLELRWVYLALPVGGVLLGFFLLADLGRLLRGRMLEDLADARRGDG